MEPAKFMVKDIPGHMCSHLVYAFIHPTDDGGLETFTDESTLRQMINLKSENPKLKMLVAVGGAHKNSAIFSKVISP